MTREVVTSSIDQTIGFRAYTAVGAPILLAYNSAGIRVYYRIDQHGRRGTRVELTPLVQRVGAGVHTDKSLTNIASSEYHEVDLPDAACSVEGTYVCVEVEATALVAGTIVTCEPLYVHTPATGSGGGGGDATLANQVAILAALSGTPISPVARVASGGAVLLYVGDDATQLSATLLSIPVDDPAGGMLAKLQAIGVANLSWGASRSNLPASAISGTVKTLTAGTVDGRPVCLIGVEVRAAGVSPACAPADDYVYQISQRQTHASDLDDFVEIEGSLELRRRTVAIPS